MTMTTTDTAKLEAQLNETIRAGRILDAIAAHYADDCEFQEGAEAPRVGRAAQEKHLEGFFATLQAFNGATLHAQAVDGGVALTEWTFDMVGPDGAPIVWNEVLRRRWRDGKVVSERYYQAD